MVLVEPGSHLTSKSPPFLDKANRSHREHFRWPASQGELFISQDGIKIMTRILREGIA